MTIYLVERFVPRSEDPGVEVAARARATAELVVGADSDLGLFGSIVVPEDEMSLDLVSGPSIAAIHDAHLRAGVPYQRITEADVVGLDRHQPQEG